MWENGKMQDLNTLIPPGSTPQTIGAAHSINNRGQILVDIGNKSALLTPTDLIR